MELGGPPPVERRVFIRLQTLHLLFTLPTTLSRLQHTVDACMAPVLGSSPPISPSLTASTSSISQPLPPQDYGPIFRSIQRRSADRLSGDHSAASWRLRSSTGSVGEAEGEGETNSLEADLKLAAEIGVALLQEKSVFQQRIESMDRANQKLLGRLSNSIKENNQLQRRLEETVGNLEQADSSNRALLVSLEEDRKTISRLSADSGKLVATSTNLRNLQRTHEDTLQELASERKRASAAENKAKKVTERANELEERLRTAIADLEEMRQDKVLRSRKSGEALAKVRAKYGRGDGEEGSDDRTATTAGGGGDEVSKYVETDELLKLVENLVSENNLLRSESMELHGLLESTREEQIELRSTMANRDVVPEEDEEEVRRAENDEDEGPNRFEQRRLSMFSATSAPPECITSPSLSQGGGFDHDSHRVPLSPGSSIYHRVGVTSPFSSQPSDLDRSYGFDFSSAEAHNPNRPPAAVKRSTSLRGRRPPPVSSNSTGALNSAKVPFGRSKGHNRRSLSMDISSSGQGPSPLAESTNVPDSPNPYYSPSTRPASIFSNASEDPDSSARPRRHHRPLSLSLGPSLFPGVPEDDSSSSRPVSPFTRGPAPTHRRRASQAALVNSDSIADSLASNQSGLGISSSRNRSYVDSETQTSPPPTPIRDTRHPELPSFSQSHSDTSTPHRSPHSHPYRSPSLSPKPTSARSHTSVSDLSEERLFEAQVVQSGGAQDHRTAALGQLLEHVVKLLGRLQSADVATQTKRLAKQNLPGGDVKHVAQANLKDLVNEIDSMRDKFRRILEQERSALAKETSKATSHLSSESLISRREFVSLVKLLRDLLFEASRLRSLVNRVQLDPSLASRLGDLDDPRESATEFGSEQNASKLAATTTGGLLAPLSRLFGSTLSPGEHPTLTSRASSAQLRAPLKRGGYSAVTSATVNVEFGKAAVRSSTSEATTTTTSPAASPAARPDPPKRDISSIFAGSTIRPNDPSFAPSNDLAASSPSPMPQPRRMPSRSPGLASVASSYLPFGRILANSYRPALSSTTNAVLDSIPHAPSMSQDPSTASNEPPPTLLERQLRPRGLSDSSIRSTFLSHGIAANPHHRVLTPATLALSSEPTRIPTTVDTSALSTSPGPSSFVAPSGSGLGAISALQKQLQADEGLLSVSSGGGGGSLSRRSSAANLRSKPSQSRLRDQLIPAASSSASVSIDRSTASSLSTSPAIATSPAPIQISPPSPVKRSTVTYATNSTSSSPVDRSTVPSSLFGTLASGWSAGWTSASGGGGTMPDSYKERTRVGRD
ncbi:uncharacterized protein JCM6883_002142 [Sporobolomyces salmoneus]|uniref:uncharacterized protein n=1 Tax=Sporobolomyces salmoneus TaxID=183962 RepID=UPI00317DDA89